MGASCLSKRKNKLFINMWVKMCDVGSSVHLLPKQPSSLVMALSWAFATQLTADRDRKHVEMDRGGWAGNVLLCNQDQLPSTNPFKQEEICPLIVARHCHMTWHRSFSTCSAAWISSLPHMRKPVLRSCAMISALAAARLWMSETGLESVFMEGLALRGENQS